MSDINNVIPLFPLNAIEGANYLGKFATRVYKGHGTVDTWTATASRADGLRVSIPGAKKTSLSRADLADAGQCPREFRIITRSIPFSKRINAEVVAGVMTNEWDQQGRQCAVFYALAGGKSTKELNAVLGAKLEELGGNHLDVNGTSVHKQKVFRAYLKHEKKAKRYVDRKGFCGIEGKEDLSKPPVSTIRGTKRVAEASDLFHCSQTMIYGIPESVGQMVQLGGRSDRKKDDTHPHKEVNTVVLFVPVNENGEAVDSNGTVKAHSTVLMHISAAFVLGGEPQKILKRAVVQASAPHAGKLVLTVEQEEERERELERIDELLHMDAECRIQCDMAKAKFHEEKAGARYPIGELKAFMDDLGILPVYSRHYCAELAARTDSGNADILLEKVKRASKFKGPIIRRDLDLVYDELLEEIAETYIEETAVDLNIRKATSNITSAACRNIALRTSEAFKNGTRAIRLDFEDIVAWVTARGTGKPPSSKSKNLEEARLGDRLIEIRDQLNSNFLPQETVDHLNSFPWFISKKKANLSHLDVDRRGERMTTMQLAKEFRRVRDENGRHPQNSPDERHLWRAMKRFQENAEEDLNNPRLNGDKRLLDRDRVVLNDIYPEIFGIKKRNY